MGNNFVYPSVKIAKHPDRLQDYRKFTISQILESFRFWISSDYANGISLSKYAFDDVFGNLFDDCDVHFDSFIFKGVNSCSTYDVFFVLILLSDELMSNKIQLLFQLGKEQDIVFRVDLIQTVIYKVVTSCSLLFDMPNTLRDDIFMFVEIQLTQFIERNSANTFDSEAILSHENIDLGSGMLSSIATCNQALKIMTFDDIYQWCQDVFQINTFLQSIEGLAFEHRVKSSIRPDSSPSTARKHSRRTLTLVKSAVKKAASGGRMSMANVVMQASAKFKPTVSSSTTSNLFTRVSHPLWTYTIKDIIVNYSGDAESVTTLTVQSVDSTASSSSLECKNNFYEDVPEVTSEDILFVALEQCILSNNKALPVYGREPISATTGLGGTGCGGGGGGMLSRETSFKKPLGSVSYVSTNVSGTTSGINSPGVLTPATSFHASIATLSHTPLVTGMTNLSMNIGSKSVNTSGQVSASTTSNNGYKDKYELFGIVDHYLVLSWMVQCCPTAVLQQIKQEEELARIQAKQNQEFGLNQSIMIGSAAAKNSENSTGIEDILTNAQHNDGGGNEAERSFSLASVSIPSMNRTRARNSLTGHQWQETGENIAFTTIRYVLSHCKHVLPCNRYTRENVFTVDQYIYNAIFSIAKGYKYVPVASASYRPYKVTHLLTTNHIIRFILAHSAELLGKFKDTVVVNSGIMRQPVVISNKLNFGSALYKLAKHHLDSILVTDEKNKIQVVLTTKCVTDFWFVWCQQARKLDRSLTLADIRQQFQNNLFKVYKEGETVSFSIFSSLLTPLVHCQAILNINIVSFDKFIQDGSQAPKAATKHNGAKKVSMSTIVERSHSYSDTDSDSDSDNSDCSEGEGRRRRANSSGGDEDDDSDEGSDSDGKGKRKSKGSKKSKLIKKSSFTAPIGSKSPPTKKKSLAQSSEPPNVSAVNTADKTTSAPSVGTASKVIPTAPKASMRSSIASRRTIVASAPTAVVPTALPPAQTGGGSGSNSAAASQTVSPAPSRPKTPTGTAADRASLVASAARATQLVNNRMTALTNAMAAAATTNGALAINTNPLNTVSATAVGSAGDTPTSAGRSLALLSPASIQPSPDGSGRLPIRLISTRMTKQQIAQQKALAAKKKELQDIIDTKIREARTLENWFRTMKLLTVTDTIQSALQIMLLTDSTRAYIANKNGEAVGVITLQDICKELILQEAKLKQTQLDSQQEELKQQQEVKKDHFSM